MSAGAAEKLMEIKKEGRITCRYAKTIAEETGVSYAEMGRLLDEMGIKITDCELGCF